MAWCYRPGADSALMDSMDHYLLTRVSRLLICVAVALAGCSDSANNELLQFPSAQDIQREQSEAGAVLVQSNGSDVQALAARGATLWKQCRVCHQVGSGAQHLSGPALNGVIGRKAGSAAGFGYSTAMQSADFIWTERALDAWLARPWKFLPGTTMQYGGMSRAKDREAMIAYLRSSPD